MKTRTLGKTGIELPILSFGASSLGQEFRSVALDDALKSVQVALDCGLNFIDTSPFYGRGMSEVLLGIALRGVPRDSYKLCTKIGRYDLPHFDFSAKRVAESIDVSLHRLGTDHLDIVLCHDIEFVPMQQIVDETVPYLKAKGVGVMNAGPFSARLLTNAPLPAWLKEPEEVKAAARAAAAHCAAKGSDIAKLALQFSLQHPDITTTVSGSANPTNIRNWAKWAAEPIDQQLLAEVQAIFAPVKNLGHLEGLKENN